MSRIHNSLAALVRAGTIAFLLATASGGLFAEDAEIYPEAKQILKNSMDYLSTLQKFGLVTHSTIEVVLENGQKIQFDTAAAVAVMRPDKLYAARLGDLVDQEFFYDGKTLTLHQVDAGFYATVDAPDSLEGMLDFARDSLDIVAPAGDFIYRNAYDLLMEDVESGFLVGPSMIEGVLCDHLAFSKPGTDFQVWIAQGETPLPLKLVITSRDVMNAPQFTVLIREWDIVPDLAHEKFNFTRPDEAQPIEFIVLEPASN
jgi:hypothetical protein